MMSVSYKSDSKLISIISQILIPIHIFFKNQVCYNSAVEVLGRGKFSWFSLTYCIIMPGIWPFPASTTTLNQRWFNINFQRCINVEIRLDLKVGWTLFQRCRRCFNVVSTLFQCFIDVYPTFYQPCNKLLFWYVFY